MKDCHYCKAELEFQRVNHVQHYLGRWYLLENVPAWVCPQCGEIYYTPQTHDDMLEHLRGMGQPERIESLNVLNLSKAG
jgi:YgiT-type zinc finger domain-containing protein